MSSTGRAVRACMAAGALLFVAACSDNETATPDSGSEPTAPQTAASGPASTAPGSTVPESTSGTSAESTTSRAPTTSASDATTLPGSTRPETTRPATAPPASTEPTETTNSADTTVATVATEDSVATEAPPIDTGTINETVPAVEQVTLAPAEIDEPAEFEGGIVAELVSVEQIRVKARLPGEISGPAFVAKVRLTNDSRRRLDVDGVTVTLEDRDGIPSSPISGDPADPFSGRVPPGDAADAVYVFTFDKATQSQPVTIGVNYSADEPVAVFVGSV